MKIWIVAVLMAAECGAATRVKPKPRPKPDDQRIMKAQILLDRAHFSPGEIDGEDGDNMHVALRGYQTARSLSATGRLDPATWTALQSDSAPALVPYTITPADVQGPFHPVPSDMMAQAELKSLGYASPAEELGERFHISPTLLTRINRGKDLTQAGQDILVPNVHHDPLPQAERVVVSKTNRTVSAYAAGDRLLAQYPATIGSEHDPLPIGDWKVTVVLQHPPFFYNPQLFWNANPQDSKAKIAPGPNNPVGVVWIGLSKEHYGIHGTPEPGTIGHAASHGCIRLTNWDAEELSKMVKKGMPAILQEAPPGAAATASQSSPAAPADAPAFALPIEGLKAAALHDSFAELHNGHPHEAIDIMEPQGTPVHAVVDGAIAKLFLSKPGGITIYQFDRAGVYCYYYAHLDRYAPGLKEGMEVHRGDVIGYVGSTGDASPAAPHLHFTIFKLGPEKHWWKGTAINPYPMLKELADRP